MSGPYPINRVVARPYPVQLWHLGEMTGYGTDAATAVAIGLALLEAVGDLASGDVLELHADCTVADPIILPSGVTFRGVGEPTITLADHVNPALSHPIIANDWVASQDYSDITVEDLVINGNKANQYSWDAVNFPDAQSLGNRGCIFFKYVQGLRIRRCRILHAWAAGIEMEFCSDFEIDGNHIENSADDCIGVNIGCYNGRIVHNVCIDAGQNGTSYGSPNGIEIQDGAYNILCSGNDIRTAASDSITIEAHKFDVSNVNVDTDVITCNTLTGLATGDAVWISASTTMPAPLVNGTTYYANITGATTLTLHPTAADAIAGTNTINLTTAGAGMIIACPLARRCSNIRISGNRCDGDIELGETHIECLDVTVSDNYARSIQFFRGTNVTISGNTLRGGITAAEACISLRQGGYHTNCVIANNVLLPGTGVTKPNFYVYGIGVGGNLNRVRFEGNILADGFREAIRFYNYATAAYAYVDVVNNTVGSSYRPLYLNTNVVTYTQCLVEGNNFIGPSGSTETIFYYGSTYTAPPAGVTIRGNRNHATSNSGTATVASGQTSVAVNHGLSISGSVAGAELTAITASVLARTQITPTNSMGNATKAWVSAVSATQITITVDADPGATTATFVWQVTD